MRPRKGKAASCLTLRGREWGSAAEGPRHGEGGPWHGVPSFLLCPRRGSEAPSAPVGLEGHELCFPCRVSPDAGNICEAHKQEHDEPCPSVPHPAACKSLPSSFPAAPHPDPARGVLSTVRCPGPPARQGTGTRKGPRWGRRGIRPGEQQRPQRPQRPPLPSGQTVLGESGAGSGSEMRFGQIGAPNPRTERLQGAALPTAYLQQPLRAVLQDPLQVLQALGSPAGSVPVAGRRIPLQRVNGTGGGERARRRLGLGQHEGVAAVPVLHAVPTPAAAHVQRPALGCGCAQRCQRHEAERAHGAGRTEPPRTPPGPPALSGRSAAGPASPPAAL